jgi:hypothetical protein
MFACRTYGAAYSLSTSACSGACSAGYYCLAGSVGATQSPCTCSSGYYSSATGSTSCAGAASTCVACSSGSYCTGGAAQAAACSVASGYYCPGCGAISYVGSASPMGTSANGFPLWSGGSYVNLPSYLTGVACATAANDAGPTYVSLNSATTIFLLRNDDGTWGPVDMTGYSLKTSGVFVTSQPSYNVYQRTVAAGECFFHQ